MFFILSKTLARFAYPLPLLILVLLVIVLFYRRRWARSTLGVALVGIYVLSLPFTANRLLHWLEAPRVSPQDLRPPYDVLIVLSGAVDLSLSQPGRLEFTGAVDRILAGMRLLREGVGKTLLISGGSGDLFNQRASEARLLKDFVLAFGVPEERLVIDAVSRNTYENAVQTARLMRRHDFQRALLITSASHMRRSLAVFHKQGIAPDPYPVDFGARLGVTPFSFVPTSGALHRTEGVMREVLGLIMYRLAGYL